MPKPHYGLKVKPREYECTVCGHQQSISSNHTDVCFDRCGGCSWKSAYKEGVYHFAAGTNRPFRYVGPPLTKEADYNPHSGIRWNGVE